MRLNARTVLTVALVVVMLGSGVAFATGVNFAPRATFCLGNLFGYGNVCTTVKKAKAKHKKKKHKKKHVARRGITVSRRPTFTG